MTLLLVTLTFLLSPAPDEEVVNGLNAKDGGYRFILEEDLRFGADEDGDEYLWTAQSVQIEVNAQGQILIGDSKVNEIRLFDAKGKYIKTVAKAGPGPGELQALARLQFLGDGRLVVFESKPMFMPRFQYFTKDLVFEKTVPVSGVIPLSATLSPKGDYFGGITMSVDPSAGSLVTKTGLVSMVDFKMVQEYSSFGNKVNFQEMGNPTVLADMIGNMIKGLYDEMGMFAFDAQGNIYAARTSRYEVAKWSPDHKTRIKTIKKEFKPIPNTKEEKLAQANKIADGFRGGPMDKLITDSFINRILETAEIPDIKPPIAGLAVLPDGHLLVIHDMNTATGSQKADLFDPKGVYRCSTTMKDWTFLGIDGGFRMVFRDGYAYTIQTDEEENNRAVRFRYKIGK